MASARPNVRTHKVSSGDTLFGLTKLGSQLRIPGTGTRG
ncbi:membrane-bound lytic murein transglycosylase D [Bordetella pertussis]|nr:membrane-bound lytic murein transglycosylase D [Bordetella pertussis]